MVINLKIKKTLLVILGTTIVSFGIGLFIVPFNLITGGVSSLAIIINHFISFDGSYDLYITIITWILFFIGLIVLGKNYAVNTLISTILYPLIVSITLRLVDDNILNGFFNIRDNLNYQEISIILAAIFGGALVGIGCAITFIGGGTTGGLDILAFIICKFNKKIKSSQIIFIMDAVLIILGAIVFGDLIITLLGITSAFICAFVIDKLFIGKSKAFVAYIISNEYYKINEVVIKELNRTTTIIDCVGGYSKINKKIVIISFTIREYSKLIGIISSIDKNAFITINSAYEINGEGWNI